MVGVGKASQQRPQRGVLTATAATTAAAAAAGATAGRAVEAKHTQRNKKKKGSKATRLSDRGNEHEGSAMVQNTEGKSEVDEGTTTTSKKRDRTAPSPPQQQHVSPLAGSGSDSRANASSGEGLGKAGSKRSKKRRRKEAAAAAAAAGDAAAADAAAAGTVPSPPVPAPASPQGSNIGHLSKKAKKARRKAVDGGNGDNKRVGQGQKGGPPAPGGGGSGVAGATGGAGSGAPKLSELQMRMRQKLEGAQFRMINETLYTSESGASLAKFKREPELFDVYHRGFREQVEKWPVHPLDIIIDWLRKYPQARVADFGCGEARLAATVPNKVHSFDLVSPNPLVTACDMAHVPIKDASVHVAVFCLSLMGTNLADFLREAHRVLVPGGLVKVAEVRSRFEGEEGGVERFLEVTRRLGFDTRQMDRTNKMFLLAEFKKSKRKPESGIEFEAKACIYKRR